VGSYRRFCHPRSGFSVETTRRVGEAAWFDEGDMDSMMDSDTLTSWLETPTFDVIGLPKR
jgi:hypothetical protein